MKKIYKPAEHEEEIYSFWEKGNNFAPKPLKDAKPFCIIMPPPNANDPLHIGHAMFVTVEDILIRYHRMRGDASLWLPGTDHAGIETQFVFEKKLRQQGKSRFNYDRKTLYKLIWDYVQENSGVAIKQMKKIGASADWSRFKFTLDKDIVEMVIDTFVRLYRDGLVYRGFRLVNYCTSCGTAFSDLEVKHSGRKTPLYYLKYGPFILATVRPETKFGDTAVAVNSEDRRYRKWIGKEIEVQGLLGKFKMKVIADSYVDPKFGTGVVKITPAHDPNDFEVWKRHINEIPGPKQVIDFDGRLNELTGRYSGLEVMKGRKKVVRDLQKAGLLISIDKNYEHSIGICYRCGNVIEPLPLPQYFIKVKPLTKKAIEVLENNNIIIYGAGHDKILKHWLYNLEDWNVSRQIAWGIRMPIWYSVEKNPEMIITFLSRNQELHSDSIKKLLKKFSMSEIKLGLQKLQAPIDAEYVVSIKSPGKSFIQETDTFDTWFSSAQWPVITLKTNKKSDFKRFYPTDLMETGYDILPFWVMRMIMMGLYMTGEVPFKRVYFHGLIRDNKGQKMSKSKGNVISPLDVVEKYGADALRMALVIRSTPGLDKNIGEADILAMRNLTNKIWNATRYIILRTNSKSQKLSKTQKANDEKYFAKLDLVASKVTLQLKNLRIGLAAETVYNQFWHWFCDDCIEHSKAGEISQNALIRGLIVFLKLMHPFVPFVTESAYQEIRKSKKRLGVEQLLDSPLLIDSSWPAID